MVESICDRCFMAQGFPFAMGRYLVVPARPLGTNLSFKPEML